MTIKTATLQALRPVVLIGALGSAMPLSAGPGSSATGEASATIVEPLTVNSLRPLEFGEVTVSSAQAGQVTVDAATGAATYNGSATSVCLGAGGCTTAAALFSVTGQDGRRYRITLPADAYASRTDGPGPDLLVSDLSSSSLNFAGAADTGLLDASGRDQVSVGGKLSIPAATPPGNYAAEISLVLTYD